MIPQSETWREVVGYEGIYSVSDFGRVRIQTSGYVLSTKLDKDGYEKVRLTRNRKRTTYSVHRIVMAAFVGIRPVDMEVNHIDGVKTNNAISNLEYCTSRHNKLHAFRTGLRYPTYTSDLTESDILRIRELRLSGVKGKDIAFMYHKSTAQISRIVNHRNWSHVK